MLVLVLAVAATVLFGLVAARLLGRGWRLALLTGDAVALIVAETASLGLFIPAGILYFV